jgi:hypothetical protein
MRNTASNYETTPDDAVRANRANFVLKRLRGERWSNRAAAMALGMSHTALGDRTKGLTAFLAEDIEGIAILLREDPVEFFREYLNAGTKMAPTENDGGHKLLDLDSNQEPTGSTSGPKAGELISLAERRAAKKVS